MKRIYLQKLIQHKTICYIGKIDPRELVKVAAKVDMGEIQDAQRPLNKKRVQDISKYVSTDDGILPNTLTLATNNNSFEIKKLGNDDLCYIDFPSDNNEFHKYEESIDVMDGQHRLYSFLNEFCKLHVDTDFEIGFTLYDKPTLQERRQIFISCNEKQEKVSGNLLMWFKKQLGMLSEDDRIFYGIVEQLSQEYPLKGHIIISAEKITNGVRAKEVMAAIKQAKLLDLTSNGQPLQDDKLVKLIGIYLSAWETFANFSFTKSKSKEAGAAIKMAGLKFMLLLLPHIWNRALQTKTRFNNDFVIATLSALATHEGVLRAEFFTCEKHKLNFRDRTVTDHFATQCINFINTMGADDFNPLD